MSSKTFQSQARNSRSVCSNHYIQYVEYALNCPTVCLGQGAHTLTHDHALAGSESGKSTLGLRPMWNGPHYLPANVDKT